MVRYQKQRSATTFEDPDIDFGDSVVICFYNSNNEKLGDEYHVPIAITTADLNKIVNKILENNFDNEEYIFTLLDTSLDIKESIQKTFIEAIKNKIDINTENTLKIAFYALTPFKVKPATRMAASLKGHSGPIICLEFSYNSKYLVTGSGDCTVRLWDVATKTPIRTLSAHVKPVTCVTFSNCCRFIASGSEDKKVCIWSIEDILNNFVNDISPKIFSCFSNTITDISFMPPYLHNYWVSDAPLLAVGALDGSAKIIDIVNEKIYKNLDAHTQMVTSVLWSAQSSIMVNNDAYEGPFLYTSSRDMTIKLWNINKSIYIKNITSHGHWVNSLTSNTQIATKNMQQELSKYCYNNNFNIKEYKEACTNSWSRQIKNIGEELIISTSDDNTIALWNLFKKDEKLCHMLGHQQPVTYASFSPNGKYIASAGFDKSIRLWDGRTGKFLHVFRGHVGAVYRVCWASDSRLLTSCSKDSTIKIWNVQSKKLNNDLPGAADEIYALDWSADGANIANGGKDHILRFWSS